MGGAGGLALAPVLARALALALGACGGGGSGPVVSTPPPHPPYHGAVTAWRAGATGAGAAIAVVDTGIDPANPEFTGRILPASADVTGNRGIAGEDDHGPRVALAAAAAARNGEGGVGIAYAAPLLVHRADRPGRCASTGSDAEAQCLFDDRAIATATDRAVGAGAVALLAQAFPNLTGRRIVEILLDSARDAGDPGTDGVYGRGVMDIAAAFAPRGTTTIAG